MLNTYKYTILSLIREKNVLIWALIFPLILGTMFYAMFSNMDEGFKFEPIEVGVINDSVYKDAAAFSQLIEALSEPGAEQMLAVSYFDTKQDADVALTEGNITGYYKLATDGQLATPELFLAPSASTNSLDGIYQTMLKNLADTFIHKQASVAALAEANPAALADESLISSLFERQSYTEAISVTASGNSVSIRYFYALLGYAAMMNAIIGLIGTTRTQANLSSIGARRAIGATSRSRTLVATLFATWTLSFACLMIAFIYLRFVLGINFGRDLEAICGLFIASFMTTGLGALFGSIPKLNEGTKAGFLTMLTCTLSLFAGLYGEAAMQLSDAVARNAPLAAMLNPARAVCDLFYSLYYYDSLSNFFHVAATIAILGLVFLAIAVFFMRRQRYASL